MQLIHGSEKKMIPPNDYSDHALEAEDAIRFMMEMSGAELLSSTLGLATPGVTIAVWRYDRFALDTPPADFHVLGFGLSGKYVGHQSFESRIGSEQITVSPGTMFYVPSNQSVLMSGSGATACLQVMLDGILMNQAVTKISADTQSTCDFPGFNQRLIPRISAIAQKMFQELTVVQEGVEDFISSLANILTLEIVRELMSIAQRSLVTKSGGLAEPLVARIIECIEGELYRTINIKALSEEIGLDGPLIEKGFEATTGITLANYTLHARLNRAFFMLAHETTPLDDIAQQVGLADDAALADFIEQQLGYGVTQLRPSSMLRQM